MELLINKITNDQIDQTILKSDQPLNSLGIQVPYEYFSELVKLNWYDILFAVQNNYLSIKAVVEHACYEVKGKENYHELELELAITSQNDIEASDKIMRNIAELAELVSDDDKLRFNDKVLYVLLSWIFEHQGNFVDPLRVIEIIYDDYNFPESMKDFVRYEPSTNAIINSRDQNVDRMFSNWQSYLKKEAKKYMLAPDTI